VSASLLEPLAARYASWLGLPAEEIESEVPAEQVRAMPVILRIERADPPGRTDLLEAAAAAALAVCLDERTKPDGEWHEPVALWLAGHIRKVTRRARGAHWHAVHELPGLTVKVGGAEVRALLPGLVTEVPKVVSRLQITGSELPDDEPGEPPPGVPLLWLNPAVPMTAGKAAAQVGHGTMLLAALLHADGHDDVLASWAATGFRCAVRVPSRAEWATRHPGDDPLGAWRSRRVVAVRDAGFTEIAPGTVTVLAQLP
jgi:peptidyl-tRNA hydrolase